MKDCNPCKYELLCTVDIGSSNKTLQLLTTCAIHYNATRRENKTYV